MDSNPNQHASLMEYPQRPKSTHVKSYQKHVQAASEDGHSEVSGDTHPNHPPRPEKSITNQKMPVSSVFSPKPINAVSNEDVKAGALPVPIPDVGQPPAAGSIPTTLVVHPGLMPVTTPTPNMPALAQNPPVATYLSASNSLRVESYAPFPTYPPHKKAVNTSNNHLLVIIFASLGGAFLLVALFVLFKIRTRPRRRYHPTPSLPILQDDFPDRPSATSAAAEDSPIFGGKERFSTTLGDDEKWTWTQYHSKSPTKNWQDRRHNENVFADPDEKSSHPLPPNDTLLSVQPSTRKRPNLLSRSLSRVSTLSSYSTSKSDVAGLLPNTPKAPSLTEDPFTDRAKPRTSYRRSRDKHNLRITVKDWDAEDPEQYIYGGAEFTPVMPVVVEPVPATLTTGRQRIKAPYPVGSCPSMTSIAPSISPSPSTASDPFEDTPFAATSFIKTEARRERDTKALTAALGLHSPPMSSSGNAANPRHHAGTGDSRKHIPGSPIDSGMRMGNFMMSDYPETPLTLSTKPLRIPGDPHAGLPRTRVDDKPPRVPSPPALPSLAQMAMTHNNGLDYDSYRSPTYSLYDIYANTRSIYGGKTDPSDRV